MVQHDDGRLVVGVVGRHASDVGLLDPEDDRDALGYADRRVLGLLVQDEDTNVVLASDGNVRARDVRQHVAHDGLEGYGLARGHSPIVI